MKRVLFVCTARIGEADTLHPRVRRAARGDQQRAPPETARGGRIFINPCVCESSLLGRQRFEAGSPRGPERAGGCGRGDGTLRGGAVVIYLNPRHVHVFRESGSRTISVRVDSSVVSRERMPAGR